MSHRLKTKGYFLATLAVIGTAACARAVDDTGGSEQTAVPPAQKESQEQAPQPPRVLDAQRCAPDGHPASTTLLLHSNFRFLSDLNPTQAANGYGPAEKDQSNGGPHANDGGPITIGHHRFARGLGTHAPSHMVYAVPKGCVQFGAQIGLNASVAERGTVSFRVLVDGQLRFDSGLIRGTRTPRRISVDIVGAKQVELVVLDGGDGADFDHSNWADAMFVCPQKPRSIDNIYQHLEQSFAHQSQIDDALAKQQLSLAKHRLVQHLRQRNNVAPPPNWQSPLEPNTAFDESKLQPLLANKIFLNGSSTAIDLGTPPDFSKTTSYNQTHAVLHRMPWLRDLLDAYVATQKTVYRDKFFELLRAWRSQLPPVHFSSQNEAAYDTLSLAGRVPILLEALERFRQSATGSQLVLLFRLLAEHAQLLADVRTVGNYGTEAHLALATIGLLLPELAAAKGYADYGLCRLQHEASQDILPDGMHFELSPGYHMNIVTRYSRAERLASRNGTQMSEAFLHQLEKAYEATLKISRPNRLMPNINDSNAQNYHRPWLAYGAMRFGRSDFKHLATKTIDFAARELGGLSKEEHSAFEQLPTTLPQERNHELADAGLLAMRSGWNKNDLFLLFDLGKEGGPHTHQASMNVDLYGLGRSVIVDPGVGGYDHPSVHFFKSPEAHNVIAIDGQARASAVNSYAWHQDEIVQTILGEVNLAGHRWLRAAVMVGSDYWLVLDTVAAGSSKPKTIEQFWHQVPGQVDIQKNEAIIRYPYVPSAPEFRLLWPEKATVSLSQRPGYMGAGVNGNAPLGEGAAAKTSYLVATSPAGQDLNFMPTLILPSGSTNTIKTRFEVAPVEGGILLRVERGPKVDFLVFAYNPPIELFGLGTMDGWFGIYRIENEKLVASSVASPSN